MKDLKTKYAKDIVPALRKQFGWINDFQVPTIEKITLNVGVGRSLKDQNVIAQVEEFLTRVTGQKPIRTKAKKSIAAFKVREGNIIGLSVTLRKKRMYDFLEKLLAVALPRIRDFRGIDAKAVDGGGNLSIGFRENLSFPEVMSEDIERSHGLQVTITTTASTRESGLALFTLLGFPFKK